MISGATPTLTLPGVARVLARVWRSVPELTIFEINGQYPRSVLSARRFSRRYQRSEWSRHAALARW